MKEKTASIGMLGENELNEIRTLIERRSGIYFDASRERFFSARVREYAADKGLAGGTDLLRALGGSNAEYDLLLERLLTQETSFFRYPAVYEALAKTVLPEMHARKFWENPRTLRIWSAGCATGEEPYSIAIAITEGLVLADAWDIEILATDISRQALRQAERALYPRRSLQHLSPRQVETHFSPAGKNYAVKPRIRRMVGFSQMNLAEGVYAGKFDCIFCMNVLMYFTEARRKELLERFFDYLNPGGYLLLGHAESLAGARAKFEARLQGECILYRRPETGPGVRTHAEAVL